MLDQNGIIYVDLEKIVQVVLTISVIIILGESHLMSSPLLQPMGQDDYSSETGD